MMESSYLHVAAFFNNIKNLDFRSKRSLFCKHGSNGGHHKNGFSARAVPARVSCFPLQSIAPAHKKIEVTFIKIHHIYYSQLSDSY